MSCSFPLGSKANRLKRSHLSSGTFSALVSLWNSLKICDAFAHLPKCGSGGAWPVFCARAHEEKAQMARECVTAKLQASHCRLYQQKLEESRSARTLERAGGGFGGVPSSRSLRVAFEPVNAGWEAFDLYSISRSPWLRRVLGSRPTFLVKVQRFTFFVLPTPSPTSVSRHQTTSLPTVSRRRVGQRRLRLGDGTHTSLVGHVL